MTSGSIVSTTAEASHSTPAFDPFEEMVEVGVATDGGSTSATERQGGLDASVSASRETGSPFSALVAGTTWDRKDLQIAMQVIIFALVLYGVAANE